MHLARLLLAACAALGLALGAGAANWPRFRGPNGSGAADDKDIPVQWTDKDVLWKVALPGAGNSSPIVWGDRLFIQSASSDGKERYLLCLSTADGKEVWKRAVGGARAKMHPKNSGASSTPATDGERVYAYFWDGESVALHAFDIKGEPLWRYDIGKFSSDHGAGASPMVYGGKVVLLNDQGEGGSVIALDGKTGQRAWEAKRGHFQNRACYATPFVLERKGQPAELVVASTMGVTGYDPATGAETWQYELTFPNRPLRVVSSPFPADGGLIVVSCGDGSGERKTFAIRPGGKDGTPPSLAWDSSKDKEMPYVPGFLSRGEHLYWVNDYGFAGCTLTRTGAMLWSHELARRGAFSASPVLIGDKVYAADEAGDVFVFAAEPTFKLLARNRLGEKVIATPAVADGRLFIRGDGHLYCVGKGK